MESRNLLSAILFGVLMFQDILTPEKVHVSAVMLDGNETDYYQMMLNRNLTGISKILDMLQFSMILNMDN